MRLTGPLREGHRSPRASLVLLSQGSGPIADNARLFVEGIKVEDADGYETVPDPAQADAIIVPLEAPFEQGRGSIIGEYFHGGTLAFPPETIKRLAAYAAQAPLYISVFLKRPAIVGPLVDLGATVIGEFGASDGVVLDAFRGRVPLSGRLPFDIPSSMEAVEASREDVPLDTAPRGFVHKKVGSLRQSYQADVTGNDGFQARQIHPPHTSRRAVRLIRQSHE